MLYVLVDFEDIFHIYNKDADKTYFESNKN